MDNGENIQIERMVRQKKGRPGEEIEVLLSDASSFFAALKSWQQHPFHEGDTLTPEDLRKLRDESATISVRSRAMALLSRAEHSHFMLSQKLVSRGHEQSIVTRVLDELAGDGLLDDARFAASWTRDRVRRHPEGRSMLVAGLRQRGVSSQVAEDAVSDVFESEEFSIDEVVLSLAHRFFRARGATPDRVTAKLLRRGFPHTVVRRAINEISGTDPAESEE